MIGCTWRLFLALHLMLKRQSLNLTIACSVDLKDIAMLGKWSNEHIAKSYVNDIPLSAVLARAGFQRFVHMIPRSTVEAPQELLDMIFPGIEDMLEAKQQVCPVKSYAMAVTAASMLPSTACCTCDIIKTFVHNYCL